MKRLVLLSIVSVMLASGLHAARISQEMASIVAHNFMERQGVKDVLALVDCGIDDMYIYVAEGGGFVVVAGDDCVRPILGYSSTAHFADTLPEHILLWLQGYAEEMALLRSQGAVASELVQSEWQALFGDTPDSPLYTTVVAPMLTTQWKQGSPYNTLCPHDTLNQDTKAGCVAIAMAQVMKYWNHPTQGEGSYSYSYANCGTQSVNFGAATYDWANMPNTLTSVSPTVNINAVATLVYHAGVSVKMKYGHSSSSATTLSAQSLTTITGERALRTYFKYDKALHSMRKAAIPDSVWLALINDELAAGRPVIYSGRDVSSGHAFVCDGRNNAGLYHFNWGWGGYCDGYYQIGALNPAPGGTGGNPTSHYNLENKLILGIQPDTVLSGSHVINAIPTDSTIGTVTGSGTYNYGDTVTLTALAANGYRFARWSDGMCYNPRNIIVGGDKTYTAVYEPVVGDTLRYDNGLYLNSWGYSTARPYYWGVKFEASSLTAGARLDAVMAYLKVGTYCLGIHQSSVPSSSTMLDSVWYTSTSEGWHTISLGVPIMVDTTNPLWLLFYNDSITYPACAGNYCGHQLGAYSNSNGTSWGTVSTQRTFLIRGIFSTLPLQSIYDTIVVDTCGSYTWQDTLYTTSGTYERHFVTDMGGDSVVVLILTIYPTYSYVDTVVAENSYTWVNGVEYTASGIYTQHNFTVHNCDSLLTLVLTITQPQVGISYPETDEVTILPNPTTGVFSVCGGEVETIEVFDDRGVCVVSTLRTPHVDISCLPVGLYAVRVSYSDGRTGTAKIVKR